MRETMDRITINIDRLVLDGLDMTPTEAERFRASVASALESELKGKGLPTTSDGNEYSRLVVPATQASKAEAEGDTLASNVAQSIVSALHRGG